MELELTRLLGTLNLFFDNTEPTGCSNYTGCSAQPLDPTSLRGS